MLVWWASFSHLAFHQMSVVVIHAIAHLYTRQLLTTEVALLLITHKADIEARNKYNSSPLHSAALNNSTEVAKLLIIHKADIEARNKYNRTPLEVARNSYKDTKAVIGLLLKHAANIS